DDNTFTGANELLMNAAVATGPGLRTLSGIELAMFQDLGYTVVVPEPGTFTLLLVGLLGVAFRGRRRTA
ncbi:MAG: PEP-CTERM sorting domain-containing protein, partial [Pedosphaera parvula]|nr:PEP-CTERM sorting domain-containing protein [Pedosphaera parvula]